MIPCRLELSCKIVSNRLGFGQVCWGAAGGVRFAGMIQVCPGCEGAHFQVQRLGGVSG